MTALAPLLEIQELDLAAGRLREKRAALPERAALVQKQAELLALGRASEAAQVERDQLENVEGAIGEEVASMTRKAQEVEKHLYSGVTTIPKELDALQQELEMWKQKQEQAEEQELELLEQIEAADVGLAQQGAERSAMEIEGKQLAASIAAAEAAIDKEIGGLEEAASGLRAGLPALIMEQYDRLRGNARLAGIAAVALKAGTCQGCRLSLPRLEHSRIREQPEDAVVCCVHCGRLLVR